MGVVSEGVGVVNEGRGGLGVVNEGRWEWVWSMKVEGVGMDVVNEGEGVGEWVWSMQENSCCLGMAGLITSLWWRNELLLEHTCNRLPCEHTCNRLAYL